MGALTKQMRGSKLAPSSYSPCSFCSYDTFYRLHVHMRSNLCEHGRHIQRQQATYPKFLLDLWMKFLSWRHHQVLMSGFEASNTYDFYVNYRIFPRKQTHDRPVFLLKRQITHLSYLVLFLGGVFYNLHLIVNEHHSTRYHICAHISIDVASCVVKS